jgi:lantibiotic modifying enzyme
LFFALVARILGFPEYRSLALQAVEPLRRELCQIIEEPGRARDVRAPIGGLKGLGSLVYGLVRLGDVLEEPELWDEALEITSFLTLERMIGSQIWEIMTGASGALLALLALHRRRPVANRNHDLPIDLALAAANHLARHRSLWAGQAPGSDPPSIGFCHGTAGVAYALGRIAKETDRSDFEDAARAGWSYVETCYDPKAAGWHLAGSKQAAGNSWCNGATGILLGVLTGLCDGIVSFEGHIADALLRLRSSALELKDHLCCGAMGRVDALVYASVRLQDEEMLAAADHIAESVLVRARKEGKYRLMFFPEDLVDLRLFPGLAGVGYAFLRLIAPDKAPCLLSME